MMMMMVQQHQLPNELMNGHYESHYCHLQEGERGGDFDIDLETCSVQEYATAAAVAGANVAVERLSRIIPTSSSSAAATRTLSPPPAATHGVANIFIAVSVPGQQQAPPGESPRSAGPIEDPRPSKTTKTINGYERCYPDLLDIGFTNSSCTSYAVATLPRHQRGKPLGGELGSPYDNMGPRVTATGSSTFSLVEGQPQPEAVLCCEPPLLANGSLGGMVGAILSAPMPLIQPPPEFVSL